MLLYPPWQGSPPDVCGEIRNKPNIGEGIGMGHASPPPQGHPTLRAKTLRSSIPGIKEGGLGGTAASSRLLTWASGPAPVAAAGRHPGLWVLLLGTIALHSSQASLCWVSHHLSPTCQEASSSSPPILSPYRLQPVLPLSGHLSNRGLPLSSYSLCPSSL